jgi:hypothetical protein
MKQLILYHVCSFFILLSIYTTSAYKSTYLNQKVLSTTNTLNNIKINTNAIFKIIIKFSY